MQEDLLDLQYFLDGYKIKFFSAKEVTLLRRDGVYKVPPRDKWDNIVPTLRFADAIRALWGGPVRVNSGYRPSYYNKKIGGVEGSQHLFFTALDLSPSSGCVEEFKMLVIRLVKRFRSRGINIGLGVYPWGVHIDVDAKNRSKNRTFGPEAPANF